MEKVYQGKLKYYLKEENKVKRKLDIVSNLRLIVILVTIFSLFYFYFYVSVLTSWIAVISGVLVFMLLVKNHNRLNQKYKYISSLRRINERNIDRLKGKWIDFREDGKGFIDPQHKFTYDLDIFGRGSLYQFLCTCSTPGGKEKLKDVLSTPEINIDSIQTKQEAVKELSQKLEFRQKFNALGMLLDPKVKLRDEKFKERNKLYSSKLVKVLVTVLPIITILSAVGAYLFDLWDNEIVAYFLVGQLMISIFGIRWRGRQLNLLVAVSENLSTYKDIISLLENERFNSKLIMQLKKNIKGKNNQKASVLIGQLGKISDRASNRKNLFFLPINILLLWDYNNAIQLENWKDRAGDVLETIEEVMGDLEALCSLSQATQDNPNWSFPSFSKDITFKAVDMAHPLLIPEGVKNSIEITQTNPMLLITGSNMSGKSTLLRTVGINLILAYAGAPTCGKSLKVSIFDLHTCMRISDNLEKGISSFYGELLRIKEIIETMEKGQVKLVLLDEIFKGTNSYDRHIGAKALIKQLLDSGASGLVSTHDLELEILERETKGEVKNYHFKEYYVNNEIKFDYKLREGVSTTRNALYLLKLVGIELDC